jgi:hypothetical protein
MRNKGLLPSLTYKMQENFDQIYLVKWSRVRFNRKKYRNIFFLTEEHLNKLKAGRDPYLGLELYPGMSIKIHSIPWTSHFNFFAICLKKPIKDLW